MPSATCSGHPARRRRVTIGCLAAAVLVHAVLAWVLLRPAAPAPPRSSASAVVMVRWLRLSAPPAAEAPAQAAPERALPRSEVPRVRPSRVAARARNVAAPPQAAPATAVPIDGTVFALPRVAYGDAPRAAGVRAFAPGAAVPAMAPAQHVLRDQIAEHLERQLAALPPVAADGRCTLDGIDEPLLLCDSETLTAVLAEHALPLARLLAAHQRSMPGATAAAIEAHAGRFRLSQP